MPTVGPDIFEATLLAQATDLLSLCSARGLRIATAESCTGGLIAGCLTSISGCSSVVERGFVTYSNDSKTEMLGVPSETIIEVGAVSEAVAKAMAQGALAHSRADLAISVTGVAGPTGGSAEKPVGTVWIGLCRRGQPPRAVHHLFDGDRTQVRLRSVAAALALLHEEAQTS